VHELHISLCKRSLEYIQASKDAFNKGLYNASGLMSQISAKLAIKATIAFLGYSFPETHEIRKLLSTFSSLALKDKIATLIRDKRSELDFIGRRKTKGTILLLRFRKGGRRNLLKYG